MITRLIIIITFMWSNTAWALAPASNLPEVYTVLIAYEILSLYPEEIAWVREHSKRVARIAEIIAERMYLGTELIRLIRIAALGHDLGKGCSAEMIEAANSRGPKMPILDAHREESIKMLRKAGIFIDPIVEEAVRYHHDPWLTKGGITKLVTEIIYLADQIDASQDSHRPYPTTMISIQQLLSEFRSYYKIGERVSKPVYKAFHRLLIDGQPDLMEVIYEARGGINLLEEEINRRLSRLLDFLSSYNPQEHTLSLRWDREINAVDLGYFYRYVSGIKGMGEGERGHIIMSLLLAIINSSLDIKGYDAMKPFSDLILLDRLRSDAIRSHAREFRNNFDPSGDKSRAIIALLRGIKMDVSEGIKPFVKDFMIRCGYLMRAEREMPRVIRTFNGVRVVGRVSDRIRKLVGYIARNDRLALPETLDVTRPRYIVVNKDREKNRLEDILRDRYDIHVVTEIPSDGEFVVLVNPEDVGRWEGQELLYLPLPYMEQSLKLAAGMLLSEEEIAHNYVKDFYNILLGRNLTDEEVANLFLKPWWILPEISALKTDLIILREAISQLEKSA